ncbi:zona pellucida sperm-binding protein 3 [Garra rufa]|uniref:zona pellucida sperm-binding protein 3 n=1 Tax=Garra rufa TaxID=137080 RepID=UPI003CCEEB16
MKHRNGHTKQRRMWLNWLLIIILNISRLVDSFSFDSDDLDLEEDWESMISLTQVDDDGDDDIEVFQQQFRAAAENETKQPLPLKLPESVRIPASQLYKPLFKPQKGSRPVPPLVRSILLPAVSPKVVKGGSASKKVEVFCFLDRVYVRVLKSLFNKHTAWKYLKLGTCAANKASATHYYFLYPLTRCGMKRGEDANYIMYTNTLYFKPVVTGLIVRELPFTIPIRCTYTKFHRSYQVGYLPKLAGGTFIKNLQAQAQAPTITAMDASWKLLAAGQSFAIGQPVCFEAKGQSSVTGQRLYLNSCFVSTSNPESTDLYYVVENYGCLVDSKNSALTKFYTTDSKMTAKFCVAAFLFKNMVSVPQPKKTLYMHCELEFRPETPTPSAKSCTYNAKTKKWTELYGPSSVCNCCATTCPAPPVASGKSITSKSWDLKLGQEPTKTVPEFSVADHDDFEMFWESDDY